MAKMPQIDMPGVALRLEALRLTLGMAKGDFSRSWGLDPSSYSKILDGEDPKPLKSQHAFTISTIYGVTMDFIYRGDLSKMDDATRANIMRHLSQAQE